MAAAGLAFSFAHPPETTLGGGPGMIVRLESIDNAHRSAPTAPKSEIRKALKRSHQGPLANVKIPSITRLDSGLTWKLGEGFSISVVGQNLPKDHHSEFADIFGSLQSGQIKRSAYAKVTWQF
jgi:hypothetical protein